MPDVQMSQDAIEFLSRADPEACHQVIQVATCLTRFSMKAFHALEQSIDDATKGLFLDHLNRLETFSMKINVTPSATSVVFTVDCNGRVVIALQP